MAWCFSRTLVLKTSTVLPLLIPDVQQLIVYRLLSQIYNHATNQRGCKYGNMRGKHDKPLLLFKDTFQVTEADLQILAQQLIHIHKQQHSVHGVLHRTGHTPF